MAIDTTHAQILEALGNTHEKRIVESLSKLEKRIASLIGKAPLKDGNLFDLEWAIAARRDILQTMTEEYLTTANVNVKEYKKAVESAEKMISKYTDFVGLSPEVIRGLQNVAFRGYEDIANTFVNDLANEVYNNTLTGRSVDKSILTMRQKINGVYAQSDQVEIERLVNIANAGGSGAAEAIKALHSVYAADKLGNNMRRYASQMVHDALMQFDAAINVQSGKETGATHWKYYGSVVNDTRPFCEKHAGKVYTEDEIDEIWAGDWAGKAAGDPFIVRGGYNCRHHWRPYYTETEGEVPATKAKAKEADSFVIPDDLQVKGSKEAFITEMNKLSEDQIRLSNKLPKPSSLEDKASSGSYYPISKRLEADVSKRSGSIVRHEYGHHIDYMLGKEFRAISEADAGFLKAIEADKKALGLSRMPAKGLAMEDLYSNLFETVEVQSKSGLYKIKKSQLKNDELGNFSDIVDALTKGDFQSFKYGTFGHGKTYYKRAGSVPKEIFANMFALRNTPYWQLAKQKFPELAKRFDEIIAEGLK
jgi:hypothetical protein